MRLASTSTHVLIALGLTVAMMGCGDDDGTEADRRGIGADCATADDCFEMDQSCLTQFTGGYCGRADCLSNDDCPVGSACVAHDDGSNYCFRLCLDKPECNRHRALEVEANCSSSVVYADGVTDSKACIPPSSGI